MLSLGAIPWSLARRAPGTTAIVADGRALSAAELDSCAAGVAARLRRLGIGAGDRVALLCGNGLAFPAAYYGALRLGAVVAPLSTAASPLELRTDLRRLRARLLVCDEVGAEVGARALREAATGAIRLVLSAGAARGTARLGLSALTSHPSGDPVPVPAGAPAVVLSTSGTTGLPKRAVHSHAGLLLNAGAVASEMLSLGEADRQLAALPLAHSFGMSAVLNASLLAGAGIVVLPSFDAEAALEAIIAHQVTVVQGVPTMLRRLALAAHRRPAGLRLVVVSGAPLGDEVSRMVRRRLSRRALERYGMTECSPLTFTELGDGAEPGDVGRPLRGVVVRTVGGVPDGELEAASPAMFLGYDRDPRATRTALVDGFLRTGDLGRVGDDGRVVVRGRLKDVVVRGGNNVSAREVERVLEAHRDVVEAAVVGVADLDLGEEVGVVLVPRAGSGSENAIVERLRSHCAGRLAPYKVPRHWRLVGALPRTQTGKPHKAELASLLELPSTTDAAPGGRRRERGGTLHHRR